MFEGWLIVFVIFLVIEISTVNLVTIWFAVGSIVASIVSLFTGNVTLQLAVFVITSAVSLILTKPLVDKFRTKKIVPTNLDMVIGKIGIVTLNIDKDVPGEVKVAGKRWTAVADTLIKKDEKVEVVQIDGVKLNVKKIKEEI